ncbi:MAG TPA: hypothetical protein ENK49_14120 [Gammaproteobacteria bacterium]|nr:hypothetical protein [Gammaproteobacteria bacterium]
MNIHKLVSIFILGSGLLAASGQASADQKRSFGFVGEVNSLDRGNSVLVVDDRVFHISDDVRVHSSKTNKKSTLSAIRPGVKVGFYPARRDRESESTISSIWVLPANWKGQHGYSDDFEN